MLDAVDRPCLVFLMGWEWDLLRLGTYGSSSPYIDVINGIIVRMYLDATAGQHDQTTVPTCSHF